MASAYFGSAQPQHDPKKKHHERPLKWFASPISHEEQVPLYHTEATKLDQIPIPLHPNTEYASLAGNEQQSLYPTISHPVFKRNHESTPSELFYDLFFVANLTAFTAAHEINDGANLRSYIGFFSLLWFTWFNVSLFDLRLARDSVFDRVAKAIQFGVMTGFVGVGAEFTPNKDGEFESGFIMSVLLGVSRWTLCVQYCVSFYYLKGYKGAYPPLLLTIGTTFLAGAAYFASGFLFPPFSEHFPRGYIVWYFLCGIETGLTLLAAMRWRLLSFKGTHVVERMSLLTLIILGEGVIGMAEAIHKVLEHDLAGHQGSTTASFRGAVVSAILLLYFLYMLYFDWLPDEHFGTIRSQIWAWFHFPLHVALVLFVEGSAQGLKWRRITGQLAIHEEKFMKNDLFNGVVTALGEETNITQLNDFVKSHNTTEGGEEFFTDEATGLAAIFQDIAEKVGFKDIASYNEVLESLSHVADGFMETERSLLIALLTIYVKSSSAVLEAFGASLPEEGGHKPFTIHVDKFNASADTSASTNERRALLAPRETPAGVGNATEEQLTQLEEVMAEYEGIPKLFNLTFMYFYISGGLALMALGILAMLGKKTRWNRWDWLRFAGFFGFGLMLALLSLTVLTDATVSFASSPMVVPLAMLLVFMPVIVSHL